jgi:hypothetical protein
MPLLRETGFLGEVYLLQNIYICTALDTIGLIMLTGKL